MSYNSNPPQMNKVRSSLIIIALVAVAIIAISWAISAKKPPTIKEFNEPVLSVKVTSVSEQSHRPMISLIGKVEALDYTTLTAPIVSDIIDIYVREGDVFKANEPLIALDLRELEYTNQMKKANLQEIKAQIESVQRNQKTTLRRSQNLHRQTQLAEKRYKRYKNLVAEDVVTAAQLENTETTLLQNRLNLINSQNNLDNYYAEEERLKAQKLAAESSLKQSQLQFKKSKIKAPFDGQVAKVHSTIGSRSTTGSPLLDIFNPNQLRLRVSLPQRYAFLAYHVQETKALLSYQRQTITLSLSRLEPKIEEGGSNLNAFFALPKKYKWIIGQAHLINLFLPPLDSIAVPQNALYADNILYYIDTDSRARPIECALLGMNQIDDDDPQVLLRCPKFEQSHMIITNQIPSLLEGNKVKIVNNP